MPRASVGHTKSKTCLDLSLCRDQHFLVSWEASKWSQSPSNLPNGLPSPWGSLDAKWIPLPKQKGNSLLVSSTSMFQQHYVQLTTHQWHRSLVTLIQKIHNPNTTFKCCTERNEPTRSLIHAELSEAPKEKKTRLRLWKLVPEVPLPALWPWMEVLAQ